MPEIDVNSRFQFSNLYRIDDELYWGLRDKIKVDQRPDDQFHTIIQGDRIDLLSFRLLGDSNLWWVIADYNDLFFVDVLEVGKILRVPSKATLEMVIFSGG